MVSFRRSAKATGQDAGSPVGKASLSVAETEREAFTGANGFSLGRYDNI